MKICMVLQNQYAKLGHAIARILKDEHGVAEFCAYVISPGAADFVRSQTNIHYSSILVDHELHTNFPGDPLDISYIRQFEKTYGPPYIWQYLYCDRKLMMSMGPKEETTTNIDPLYPHEDLLRAFQARARAIEQMLNKERPDAIFFFSIGALGHLLLFHIAKKLGIRTYNIDFPRVGNRMCLSEDYRTLSGVEKTFREFQKNGQTTPFHDEAKKLLAQFRATGSLNLPYMDIAVGQLPKKTNPIQISKLVQTVRYLITIFKNFRRNRNRFVYGVTDQNPLRFIGQKLKQRYRLFRGMADLTREPDWSEEFVYMPLHYEPELSILLLSPFYFDQLQLARYLARSLPAHMKLYVKEHPAMVSRRARSYYKELRKIPNVVLVPPATPSAELSRHARIVATITGTAGWEASLLGIPVITFGEVFYNALSGVTRVRDIEKLPEIIRQKLDSFSCNEEEVTNFLAAALKESVPFDFSRLWYENDPQKLLSNKGVRDFCAFLIKHIKTA